MISVYLNKNKVFNIKNDEKKNLKEVIDHVKQNLIKTNEVMKSISINDKSLQESEYENVVLFTGKNETLVYIETQSFVDMAIETTSNMREIIDHINALIDNGLSHFRQDKVEEGMNFFEKTIDFMQIFTSALIQVKKFIKEQCKDITINKRVSELEIHLLSILKGLFDSREKMDLVMITDLLEYELKVNLTTWKIEIANLECELKKLRIEN
jgi:hypothetical protein